MNETDKQVLMIGVIALTTILAFICVVTVFAITDGVLGAFTAAGVFFGCVALIGVVTLSFWSKKDDL